MSNETHHDRQKERLARPEQGSARRQRAENINRTLFKIASPVNSASHLDELYRSIHRILSSVIDATNFYIALYDKSRDGNILFVNKSGLDKFGYEDDDVLHGLNAFDLLAPEDRQRAVANFTRALAGESVGLS